MFTNEELQEMIEGKIIGKCYPYHTKDDGEINNYMKHLFYYINRLPNVVCGAEWDHFGSGYASFFEFFCYKKDHLQVVNEWDGIQEIEVTGLIIDISRLTGVAIIGEDERSIKVRIKTNEELTSSHGFILDGPQSLRASEELRGLYNQVEQALRTYNIEVLAAEDIKHPLSFPTTIPTVFRNPQQYRVMDAIFYWED